MFRFPVFGFRVVGAIAKPSSWSWSGRSPGAMRGLHGEWSNYNAEPQAARNRSMKKVRFLRFDVHAEAITLPIAAPGRRYDGQGSSESRGSTQKAVKELGPAEQRGGGVPREAGNGRRDAVYRLPTFSGRWNISISAASRRERRLRPHSCAAPMKDLNSGCGSRGFDLNSGWNWQPMK